MEEGERTQAVPGDVTSWLIRWSHGDESALQEVIPVLYPDLRHGAARYLRRERADHTLDAPALVHEAFLRLVDQRRCHWRNRGHFLAVAARMMRRILVDHARRLRYAKHGGVVRRLAVEDLDSMPAGRSPSALALEDALRRLATVHPSQSRVVELHFFGGLTHEEIAAAIGVSVPTVVRRWRLARAWLYRDLRGSHPLVR